jgi:GcrA cell cycle regulator
MTRWTDEKIELAKKLWREGKSGTEVSMACGWGTAARSAVIGKMHRLGIPSPALFCVHSAAKTRPKRARSSPPRVQTAKQTALKPPTAGWKGIFRTTGSPQEPFVPSSKELDIPIKERRSLANLEAKDCKWPIGDPQKKDFHFCNREHVPGLPYCEHHARRAFLPPQPKRRDMRDAPVVQAPVSAKAEPEEVA